MKENEFIGLDELTEFEYNLIVVSLNIFTSIEDVEN